PSVAAAVQDPSFLEQWQCLVGAAVGTLGAFLVALGAFWITRVSQRIDAGHVVYFELQGYRTAVAAFLDEVADAEQSYDAGSLTHADLVRYVTAVERLRATRPGITPRLDQAMGLLYSSDLVLAAQLEGFRAAANAAERTFNILEQAEHRKLDGKDIGYDPDGLLKLVRSAAGLARAASSQAGLANEIIGAFYVNRGAAAYRIKRWWTKHTEPRRVLAEMRARTEERIQPVEDVARDTGA